MKFNKLLIPLAAMGGLAVGGSATAAEIWSMDNPGFYVGAGVGVDRVEGSEFPDQPDDVEATNTTYKAVGGWNFNRFFAVEGQYINFGTADSDDGRSEVEADGWTVGVNVSIPVTEHIVPYAKGSMLFWNADRRFPVTATPPAAQQGERDGNGNDFAYGVGVKFPITQAFDFRVEYERFEFGDLDIDRGDGTGVKNVDGVNVDNASAVVAFSF